MNKNFSNLVTLRLSSYVACVSKKEYLIMNAPFNDNYTIKLNNGLALTIFNKKEKLLVSLKENEDVTISLKKNELVYIIAESKNKSIDFSVTLEKNFSLLPYDPIKIDNPKKYYEKMGKVDNNIDPLKPAKIKYDKRNKGIYVNCNNPEVLKDSSLNKALSRVDVSNKEVFFTFEHNNGISSPFYYGYQVLNTSDKDIYVTVKNVGLQLDGSGCWLGEKEWVDFYNLPFNIKNLESLTEAEKETYNLFYGFANNYQPANIQPITYKIPPKKHIYVMGGTTKDAYNHINVFNTADMPIKDGCSNGAVLFEVKGQAEAIFYAYKDYKKVGKENRTHQGYVVNLPNEEANFGSQYVGYDNTCNGVIDNKATWEFNDSTKPQVLPVSFDNYYADNFPLKSKPYARLKVSKHSHVATSWATHINPQNNHNAIGTDMTKYITVDNTGKKIVIDANHYDGNAKLANIGNWMADYIDGYTFVNYGQKERSITINMYHTGAIACFVRDKDFKVLKETVQYAIQMGATKHNDKDVAPIKLNFSYTVKVPANSVIQFYVEYNLLANSCGNINHEVILK